MIDCLCSVRCCCGNPHAVPLAALEAALLLRCSAVCVVLLVLLMMFAAANAVHLYNQLAVVPTCHAGHAGTTRAIPHHTQCTHSALNAQSLARTQCRVPDCSSGTQCKMQTSAQKASVHSVLSAFGGPCFKRSAQCTKAATSGPDEQSSSSNSRT